jgi:hypothetical protein
LHSRRSSRTSSQKRRAIHAGDRNSQKQLTTRRISGSSGLRADASTHVFRNLLQNKALAQRP